MIKIKKTIFSILILLIFSGKSYSEISDGIFMTVGNKPITKSDIVNEIKVILILNNESYSDDKRDRLHELAIKSTIKRTIKEIELERNNFYKINQKEFENKLSALAANIFMDIETLKNVCESNDLDFSIIEDQVKVELYWNSLIFELFKSKLVISSEQINDKLKLFQEEKKINEYLISEIVISTVGDDVRQSTINELIKKIEIDGFENTARNFSISESSLKGGDLGWVNENIMSEKIKDVLLKTPIGAVSKPMEVTQGILFFKIREKRKISSNLSLEEAKNQLVFSEKTKILNMQSLSHYDKVRRSILIKYYQ